MTFFSAKGKKERRSKADFAPTWSECNYRIWKNPVISMVLAQQARGLYPKILKSKDTPLKNGFERCLTWIFGE